MRFLLGSGADRGSGKGRIGSCLHNLTDEIVNLSVNLPDSTVFAEGGADRALIVEINVGQGELAEGSLADDLEEEQVLDLQQFLNQGKALFFRAFLKVQLIERLLLGLLKQFLRNQGIIDAQGLLQGVEVDAVLQL